MPDLAHDMIAPMGKQQDVGEPDRHNGSDTTAQQAGGDSVDARLALAQAPTTPQMTFSTWRPTPRPWSVRRSPPGPTRPRRHCGR
ncbi:hypothetical protein GCM10027614_19590 [Micromonospora vulcania]